MANQKLEKLQEQLVATQDKIAKADEYIERKRKAYTNLCKKYAKQTEMHKVIPYELFASFMSDNDAIEIVRNKITMAYHNLYAKYPGVSKNGWTPSYDYEALRKNQEDYSYQEMLGNLDYDFFDKAACQMFDIKKKMDEIEELKNKIAAINVMFTEEKAADDSVTTLFEQVPELAKFINECAEKQYEFLIEQNTRLAEQWKRYHEAEHKACEYHNNRYLLSDEEKSCWAATSRKMFDEARAMKPKHAVETPDRIRRDVEMWKQAERRFLAERITCEFGKILKINLYQGADGNVNGTITGTLKTARIETIWAGGYNIQRLHTRFLVHEK